MKRIGSMAHARREAHDIRKFPHVQQAIDRAKAGGYAEGIIRMLILMARARGSVRRERLERSDRFLHSRPPFNSMTPEMRSHMIHEQTLIVEVAGADAIATLPDILNDPVDRYRALNLVLEVAGPIEEMNAPTIAMFKRFQAALLTMAHDWRDPDLKKRDDAAHSAGDPVESNLIPPQESGTACIDENLDRAAARAPGT
jgi:hypothetical protein